MMLTERMKEKEVWLGRGEEEDGRTEIIHLGLKLHVMIAAACPAAVT